MITQRVKPFKDLSDEQRDRVSRFSKKMFPKNLSNRLELEDLITEYLNDKL